MSTKDRINEFLDFQGIKPTPFEEMIGASKSYWLKCKNPSAEILVKILTVFPDLSAEWLLRGTGSMLLSEQTPQSRQGLIQMYQDLLEVRDNKIRDLEMKIIELESRKMSV